MRAGWQRTKSSLLWKALAQQKRWVFLSLFLFIVNALTIVLVASVMIGMIDNGIVDQTEPLETYFWRMIILAGIGFVAGFFQRIVSTRLSFQLEYDIRRWMYDAVQSARPEKVHEVASGQIITRALTDLHLMEQFLRVIPMVLGIIPLFLGYGIYMMMINPIIAIVAMGGLPINIWLLRRFRTTLWGLSFAEINERAEVTAAIDEPVRGIRVVKAFGRESAERARVAAVALRTYQFAMSRWRLLAKYDIPLKAAPVVFQGALLAIGARLVQGDGMTLGTFLLAFQVNKYVVLVSNMVDELASGWQYLRTAQQRIGEVLELGSEEEHAGAPLPPPSTGLKLEGVGVTLGDRRILDDVHLHAPSGTTVAVFGKPSSGKSTLAALASGTLPHDDGHIMIDGVPIRDLHQTAHRQAVQVASEEPFLLADSIRENLEFGQRDHVDDERLWTALRAAAADDFIADMDGGLDAELGDRGLTLSGGQRQRIGLARALVSAPRTLIMDDALSAVHPALEADIIRRIRATYPEMAVIALSRRTAASAVADHAIELPGPHYADMPEEDLDVALLAELGETGIMAAGVVAGLELSDELPGPSDEQSMADEAPRAGEIGRLFKWVIFVGFSVLLLQTLVQFAPEVFLGEVADTVEQDSTTRIDVISGLLVVLGVVGALAAYGFRVYSQRFAQGTMYFLRRRIFQRLSRLGIDFFDREMPGEVAARVVNDLDIIQNFMYQTLLRFMTTFAQLIVGIAIIGYLSTEIVPVAIALVVVLGLFAVVQYPVSTKAFNRSRDHLGRVTATFEEDFTARDEIHRFGAQDRQRARFDAQALELRSARRWVAIVSAFFADCASLLAQVTAAIVLLRAGNLVLAGAISVGSALSLRILIDTATRPMSSLSSFYTKFLEARVSWQRLHEPYEAEILPIERPEARPCGSLAGDITFDQVAFTYPHTGVRVLHDVSFTIPHRGVAALVGYTGAGKSSIAKLMLRTYDPDVGRIAVGGVDTRDFTLDSFRSRISVVPQEAFLFRGTIATNIAYGRPDASREEIEAAARAVSAYDELAALPGGFDHPVQEEAKNLTAAQRQLVALARAWLVQPDLLVLDEATSCLDARLEQDVLDAVHRLTCTTLMVTHRDNVLDAADQVIVIEAGRVVADGPPASLRGHGGPLDRLFVIDIVADSSPVPDSVAPELVAAVVDGANDGHVVEPAAAPVADSAGGGGGLAARPKGVVVRRRRSPDSDVNGA